MIENFKFVKIKVKPDDLPGVDRTMIKCGRCGTVWPFDNAAARTALQAHNAECNEVQIANAAEELVTQII